MVDSCTLSRPFAGVTGATAEEAEFSIRRQYEITQAPDDNALEDIVARGSWASPLGQQEMDLIVSAENLNYHYNNEVMHISGEVSPCL